MLKGVGLSHLTGVLVSGQGNAFTLSRDISLIRSLVVVLCFLAIILVIYVVFVRGKTIIEDSTSKWLLFIGLVLLSPLAYLINFGISFEESKPVEFCNSCHVMHGYVNDLKDPDSEHIAAIHYKYRWIADNQCFQCHSEYGLFGTFRAKMSGIRHIWSYYIVGYETPIKIRGTYNNGICLHCHGPVEDYQDVKEHRDHLKDIEQNKQSCFGADCHVSPHPKEAWRSQ